MRGGSACGRAGVFFTPSAGSCPRCEPSQPPPPAPTPAGPPAPAPASAPGRSSAAAPPEPSPASCGSVDRCVRPPAACQRAAQTQHNTATHRTLNNWLQIVENGPLMAASEASSSSSVCSSPVELLGDLNILQRPLQQQRHQRPVQVPLTLQGLQGRMADQTVTHTLAEAPTLHWHALVCVILSRERGIRYLDQLWQKHLQLSVWNLPEVIHRSLPHCCIWETGKKRGVFKLSMYISLYVLHLFPLFCC